MGTASYIVAKDARGGGVGGGLAKHSIERAAGLGFRAMQFNFVVSTNAPAVSAWRRLGFRVVGTLPAAFSHKTLGLVDALVMFREVSPAPGLPG